MQFTRWFDTTKTQTTLEEIEKLLLNNFNNIKSDKYQNWIVEKVSDIKTNSFNGNCISYNSYKISFDCIQSNIGIDDETILRKQSWLIVYEMNGKINYIINRKSDAKVIIRNLMMYSGKNEIKENDIIFKADEFVWLISKIYKQDNLLEGSNEALDDVCINAIRGFKGGTADLLTKISAEGESVMNIISTLSFLIESTNLSQINIELAYKDYSNINITLNNKNTIVIDFDRCTRKLVNDDMDNSDVEILIILYTEILPIIKQNYQNDIEAELWSHHKFIEFIEEVRKALEKKISNRINELNYESNSHNRNLEEIGTY